MERKLYRNAWVFLLAVMMLFTLAMQNDFSMLYKSQQQNYNHLLEEYVQSRQECHSIEQKCYELKQQNKELLLEKFRAYYKDFYTTEAGDLDVYYFKNGELYMYTPIAEAEPKWFAVVYPFFEVKQYDEDGLILNHLGPDGVQQFQVQVFPYSKFELANQLHSKTTPVVIEKETLISQLENRPI